MAEKKLNFEQRIVKAQKELKAPKSNYNSFSNYKYRSAEDILEAVKPINKNNDLLLIVTDEVEVIGDRFYIKATARLIDAEGSDGNYQVSAYAREREFNKNQDPSQITGASSSYARKYALNGLYLIDDTKDADTDELQKKSLENVKMPTKAQMDFLMKESEVIAEMYKSTVDAVRKRAGIHNDMTADDAGNALNVLKDARNKLEKDGK